MDTVDVIYYSMLGELIPEAALPWIENAFAPGSKCEKNLKNIYEARNRLLERLHILEEDDDLECIFDSFLFIQYTLCRKMFLYGLQHQEDALLSCPEQESNQRNRLRGRR